MGIYTIRTDKQVDERIGKDLELIVHRIRDALPVRAIILGGGFGRGEGSVLVNGREIRPVNDYDLFVAITDNDRGDIRRLGHDIAEQVGIRSVDLIPIPYSEVERLPATQFYYDLKYGGMLLWGENILDRIPQYEPGRIDPRSAETLLLNRLVCALEAFSEKFALDGLNGEEKFFLVNQTGKVVSACVEALLMDKGTYHHSSIQRRHLFDMQFPTWDALRRLNVQATEFKLLPSLSPSIDAMAYWDQTMTEYVKVLVRYFAPRLMQTRLGLWGRLVYSDGDRPPTRSPIEKVEMMLLLSWRAPFWLRRLILPRTRRELERISKNSFPRADWESLRSGTVLLWHELYH